MTIFVVKRRARLPSAAVPPGVVPLGQFPPGPFWGGGEALARRQAEWLAGIPGAPRDGAGPSKEYFLGLAEMYVADERFARNYGGVEGATFVRDAMTAYAERHL